MPLFSTWLGSTLTYIFYLLAMASSVALSGLRINFSRLDLPIVVFFVAYLFSIFYAVNPDFKTELLFIPLLFVLYYGGKGIARRNLVHLLLNYLAILFIFFSTYLLYQLSQVNYAYNAYYFYSTASNKVDYLTTSMYAGITLIYAIFTLKSQWIKLSLSLYSFFVVAISGARFSIFFIASLLIITLILQFRKIVFSKATLILVTALFLFSTLFIEQITKKQITTIKNSFSYSIMRINHFNKYDRSLLERNEMIDKSITAINNRPFLGYGIHSSPKILHYPYPHNMLLEAWLDAGIIAVSALFTIVTVMLSILYFSIKTRSLLALGIINLYVILAHLKSFSIVQSLLLFTLAGISVSALIYTHRGIKQ
jgi:O-antigen ligase